MDRQVALPTSCHPYAPNFTVLNTSLALKESVLGQNRLDNIRNPRLHPLTCSRTLAVSKGKVMRSAMQAAVPAPRNFTAAVGGTSVALNPTIMLISRYLPGDEEGLEKGTPSVSNKTR